MRHNKKPSSLFLFVLLSLLSLSLTLSTAVNAQANSGSPWCQKYMANCEDFRKFYCDRRVPNNDRSLTSIAMHCSTAISATGGCRYFSPDCSCSWTNVADMNRTVTVPLGGLALEKTNIETKNECKDANATPLPPTTTATLTPTVTSAMPIPPTTTADLSNMAARDSSKKPMAVSLATINIAILLALFL